MRTVWSGMRFLIIVLTVGALVAILAACGLQNQGGETQSPQPAATTGIPAWTLTPTPDLTATTTTTIAPSDTPSPTLTPTPQPVVLAGAGDISICGQDGDDRTALLLERIRPDIVFTAGDNSNESGTFEEYVGCFDASWGKFRGMIRPAPGNHDYAAHEDGAAYFQYFGESAGEIGEGYYAYEAGGWLVMALNSNCLNIDGCGPSSPQVQWLEAQLEASTARCTLAYWHHPRWTSGLAGNSHWLDAFWQVLYAHGAEIVISGHDHHYERFAPQDPSGNADAERGIRQFVVGTGGASQRGLADPLPNSEVRHTGEYGVLELVLYPDRYEWTFHSVEPDGFSDSGVGYCHE